jgi:hypothetical protein
MVMHRFIFEVIGTLAVEFGWYIPMPDEPEDAEHLGLRDLWDTTTKIKRQKYYEKISHMHRDVSGEAIPNQDDGAVTP